MTLVALCAIGAEKILGNEIKHLGYKLSGNAPGRVYFSGDEESLYRANLCLRTADRIFLLMAKYQSDDFDALFDGVYKISWQDYFKKNAKVTVDKVRSHKSKLSSEHAVQSMTQKAIYQKLSEKYKMNSMPESGSEAKVRVYIENNEAEILLDISGEPLHKRGYRTEGGTAPIRETVAAVLLQEMIWRRKTPLIDPFCGSGTIINEALLYAYNVAPGLGRHFALENLSIYNAEIEKKVRETEANAIRTDVEVRLSGSDIDKYAIEKSVQNAENACKIAESALFSVGRNEKILRPKFVRADFQEINTETVRFVCTQRTDESGLILCNPPYGERLGDEEKAIEIYKKMDILWKNFSGWDFGIITSHKDFQKNFNHYATSLKNLKAGNLDTILYVYRNRV